MWRSPPDPSGCLHFANVARCSVLSRGASTSYLSAPPQLFAMYPVCKTLGVQSSGSDKTSVCSSQPILWKGTAPGRAGLAVLWRAAGRDAE